MVVGAGFGDMPSGGLGRGGFWRYAILEAADLLLNPPVQIDPGSEIKISEIKINVGRRFVRSQQPSRKQTEGHKHQFDCPG